MAIYHFTTKRVQRSKGQTSTAFAAYRSASLIHDERTGLTFDYTKKTGVVHTEILAPNNSPDWVFNREKLWNEVEKIEKRKDAYLCKEFEFALPKELSLEKQKELAREFLNDTFVKEKGVVVDFAIHDKQDGNPHVHAMITLRSMDGDKFAAVKRRDLDNDCRQNKNINKSFASNVDVLVQWREKWAEYANRYLEQENIKERIDHRSNEERALENISTKHLGVKRLRLEKKGILFEINKLNKEIEKFNKEKIVELHEYKKLKDDLSQMKKDIKTKKFKFKDEDQSITFKIKRQFRNDFPYIVYVRPHESRVLFNLNSCIGKKVTANAIYDLYNALQRTIRADKKLDYEIEKIKEMKAVCQDIIDKKAQRQELSKKSFKNRKEIFQLNRVIYKLELKFSNYTQREQAKIDIEAKRRQRDGLTKDAVSTIKNAEAIKQLDIEIAGLDEKLYGYLRKKIAERENALEKTKEKNQGYIEYYHDKVKAAKEVLDGIKRRAEQKKQKNKNKIQDKEREQRNRGR